MKLKAFPYKTYSMRYSKRHELYFSKQKDAASYSPAENTKSNNTLFSALLSFKQSVIGFVSKTSIKEGPQSSCAEEQLPAYPWYQDKFQQV